MLAESVFQKTGGEDGIFFYSFSLLPVQIYTDDCLSYTLGSLELSVPSPLLPVKKLLLIVVLSPLVFYSLRSRTCILLKEQIGKLFI